VTRQGLAQALQDRQVGGGEAPVDVANEEYFRAQHEDTRKRGPRAIEWRQSEFGRRFAAAKADALERATRDESLRLSRQPRQTVKGSLSRLTRYEDIPHSSERRSLGCE
jgi:hypothetical protein